MNIAIVRSVLIILMVSIVPCLQGQEEFPILKAELGEPPLEDDISGWCSLGCAIGWDLEASSQLPAHGKNSYAVSKLNDGLIKTAWIEGVPDYGIGEYIIFKFSDSLFYTADSVPFFGLSVLNGYCKSEKSWQENSRVKKLKIYYNHTPYFILELFDRATIQQFTFGTIYLKPNDTLKVEILEVYPGTKFKDTVLSELILLGAH